jgi:hypothetical protein
MAGKNSVYMSGNSKFKRLNLYDGLNDEGRLLVDYLAERLMNGYRYLNGQTRRPGVAPFGEDSARELALALLEHCWNGAMPEKYPVLVDLSMLEVEPCSQA